LRGDLIKSAKAGHNSVSKFGKVMSDFQKAMSNLTRRINKLRRSESDGMDDYSLKREILLPLIDMFDGFMGLNEKIETPPKKGLFSGSKKPNEAWAEIKGEIDLLYQNLEAFLKKQGITKVGTESRPFDPSLMTAVEVVEDDTLEANMVIEEVSGGYLFRDRLLRLAKVKISRRKSGS
jgi:molecular chaperone GrpE (heat shock protein)